MIGIPPWLQVNPRDFVSAAEAGARLGTSRAEAAESNQTRRQEIASSAAQHMASLGLERQKLDQAAKQAALEAEIAQKQHEDNYLVAQQRNAVSDAYKKAQLELAKDKLDSEAEKSAAALAQHAVGVDLQRQRLEMDRGKIEHSEKESSSVLADKQGFSAAISSGMSPAEAASKYPRALTPGVSATITRPPSQSGQSSRVRELDEAQKYRTLADKETDPEKKARYAGYADQLETPKPVEIGSEQVTTKTGKVTTKKFGSPSTASKAKPSSPTQVTSKAERDALEPGTQYVGPDGKLYIKQ